MEVWDHLGTTRTTWATWVNRHHPGFTWRHLASSGLHLASPPSRPSSGLHLRSPPWIIRASPGVIRDHLGFTAFAAITALAHLDYAWSEVIFSLQNQLSLRNRFLPPQSHQKKLARCHLHQCHRNHLVRHKFFL